MKAGERPGKIITISSGAYASGRLGASHYCASKAGIVMFTKVLAMELAEQRINVNSIAPGYIDTRSDSAPAVPVSPFQDAMMKNIPWGRFGKARGRRPGRAVPGFAGGRLRDRRGARRQRRGLCRAGISAARRTEGTL